MTPDRDFSKHRVFNVTGHRDKKTRGGDELTNFRDTSHYCEQLAWHTTKETILATSISDRMLRTWDTRSRRLAARHRLSGVGQTLAWHPSGNFLAVGGSNETLSVFDMRAGELGKPLHVVEKIVEVDPWCHTGKVAAHTGSVWAVTMDPQGPYMATGGGDGLTCLWDRESLVCTRVFGSKDTPNMSLSFSHNGKYLAIASNEDTSIEVRNTGDGMVAQQLHSTKPIDSVKWNPKHLMLAFNGDYARDRDGLTSLWVASS